MESSLENKALKSGVWYTFANFITKSIGFITTPIFARILTHEEYGLFSNFSSWLGTFTVIATLNLGATFISAKYDYKDSFNQYVSSMLVLSSIMTGLCALIINIFPAFFSSLTGVSIGNLNLMFLYLCFHSAIDLFQTKERYSFGYKKTVVIGLGIALSTALFSVYLVKTLDDHLQGRIIGFITPTIVLGIIIYFLVIRSGKKIAASYWLYAIPICLPYIPHILSLSLLNSMDKMMITKICGPEQNALYSVSYTCGAVITMLVTAINTAFAPWLGEKLKEKNYSEINSFSKKYILFFTFISCGIMLITPELLLIIGGRSYLEAIYVMPPVSFGCVCQFLYSMYVSVEQFNKKTLGMAIASGLSALSNYLLNMLLIPVFGYIAAAYTTLISFMILLGIHMLLVAKMQLGNIFSKKHIFGVLLFMSLYTVGINFLFMNNIIRYCFIVIYAFAFFFVIYKEKDLIKRVVKK